MNAKQPRKTQTNSPGIGKHERIREQGRERQRYFITLSDDAAGIISQAKQQLGISASAIIELCIRKHVAEEIKG